MTEEQKIKQILDQYSSYFEHSNVDVRHTKKEFGFSMGMMKSTITTTASFALKQRKSWSGS